MMIEGWLTEKEGEWLKKTAKQCRNPIIEVGSYKGLSTAYITKGVVAGSFAPIYAVDTHQHMGGNSYPSFLKNMLDLQMLHFITPIKMSSREFREIWNCDVKLDMLFIDGDHSYDGCKSDWDMWSPLVNEGGIIALHDAQGYTIRGEKFMGYFLDGNRAIPFPGVARVADEHIKGKVDEWGIVDRICWMRV